MAENQAELAAELEAQTAIVNKIATETGGLQKKVADLEAAIAAGGPLTPDVKAKLDALKASIKTADDLVADAIP